MNKLKISSRLYISSSAFLILIAILAYYFVGSVRENIIFAEQEKLGNQYQKPLMDILYNLTQYKVDSGLSQSEKKEKLANIVTQINSSFSDLEKIDSVIGKDLLFTKEELASRHQDTINVKDIKIKWLLVATSTDANAEKIQDVINDIRSQITYMGNSSNLILDPELNSFYLVYVALVFLPQTIDRLGTIGNEIYTILSKGGELSVDDRGELQRLAGLLKESDMDRIAADYNTSFIEDKNLRGGSPTLQKNIEPQQAAYKNANEALLATIKDILKNSNAIKPEEWLKRCDAASKTSMSLWSTSVIELDALFDKRIRYYNNHVYMVLAFVSLGVILSIGFFLLILRSIAKLEKEAEEQKRDMMKKIADDFKSGVNDVIEKISYTSVELYSTADKMNNVVSSLGRESELVVEISNQTSLSVSGVSASLKQMSDSVKKISCQISKSSSLMREAVVNAKQADFTTNILAESVEQISGVLQLIETIAGKINLLALNATIESARAGEAGKGFAIVASEVKTLANQTTTATKDIASQITNVQRASNQVVNVLKSIQEDVSNVNEYSEGISSAIEEQSFANAEISSNMQSASVSVQNIINSIADVNKDAVEADNAANGVLKAAKTLSNQSETLNQQVKLFMEKLYLAS